MAESAQEAKFWFKISGVKAETLVVDFTASERVSSPYEVNLSLACEDEISFDDVVAKEAVLTLAAENADRHFHGIINKFVRTGSSGRYFLYQARLVPSLWLLSLEQDCRIFQQQSVQDIVKKVFLDRGISSDRFKFRLQNQTPTREYCVQYRESDLNFVSRLLEEEGIFYFFEHAEDKHVMIMADSTVAYQPIPGSANVTFNASEGMVPGEENVFGFTFCRRIHSGKVSLQDFNFERPSLNLKAEEAGKYFAKLEVYDYPGKYQDPKRGKDLAQVRFQEVTAFRENADGRSSCPRMTAGFTFKMTDHEKDSFNQEYFLVEVIHSGSQPQALGEESGGGGEFSYSNDFVCGLSSVPYRPERKTPKPVVEGMQTGIVAGPKGEEIYTDKYGRVKVQFHWDREGKRDENSSCWIRVAQLWAGPGWGAMYLPRIGHEVIVDFLEGDPDRPIIIGGVYHGNNMPPYPLPDEKTKSTIKSDSSLGGDGFNEIRFEDKKGKEQVFIHAEKDQDIRIKNDLREWVGNESHLIVKKDQLEMVEGDRHLTIKGDSNEKLDGTLSLKVGTDKQEKIGSKYAVDSGMEIHLKAGMNVVVESGTTLTLKVGGNFVNINPSGVFISGTMVMINSGGAAGSGSGSSPSPPKEPKEADTAKPGKKPQLSPVAGAASPQAQALKTAAQAGTPFCQN